jgi:2-phospho-L-lactate guanylyltransferase
MDAGLLPVKRLSEAKQRLATIFGPSQRLALAEALLTDALDLCSSADLFEWWVISDDPRVLALAEERGFRSVKDEGTGLNAAVELGVKAALAGGASSVTVVPADVPLAWRGDLEDLLDTGATSDVVVVPSGADGGTNGLYLSPPDLLAPRFGPLSLQAHLKAAEENGHRCSVLSLPRLALDIDGPEDVDELLSKPPGPNESGTSRMLRTLRPPSDQD